MSDFNSDENTAPVEAPVSAQESTVAPDVAPEVSSAPVEPPAVAEARALMAEQAASTVDEEKLNAILPENTEGMENMRWIRDIHINDQRPLHVGIAHLQKSGAAKKWDALEAAINYASFMKHYAIDKDAFDKFCSGIGAINRINILFVAWTADLKK